MQFKVIAAQDLDEQQRQQIAALCFAAFDEDPWSQYDFMQTAFHVLGLLDHYIVSHALWTDRTFTLNGQLSVKTAYVEYVTTDEAKRGQGLASQLLRYLVGELQARDYELAALQPEDDTFYKKLGWIWWLGDLYVQQNSYTFLTDDDEIMLYPLSTQLKNVLAHSADDDAICAGWREGELW